MAAVGSYAFYWNHYFSQDQDPSKVLGQDNILRYIPRGGMTFRVLSGDILLDVLGVVAASLTCGTPLVVSLSEAWGKARSL